MPQKKYLVDLTAAEKLELEKLLKGGKHQSRRLTRARILLLANDGKTDNEIVKALQTARPTVERTRQRFVSERIIGLPSQIEVKGLNQQTSQFELVSKTTFVYDEANALAQNITPVQHDTARYSNTFNAGRGNLTSTTRYDVSGQSAAITSSVKYNTAGAVVSQTDPLSRSVSISYSDSFNDNFSRNTYAYPTTLTDAAGNSSTVKYRYDIGANVRAESPAPQGQPYGKVTTRVFDYLGRLEKQSLWKAAQNSLFEYAYTRYDYANSDWETHSRVLSTITDTNGNGVGDTAEEVLSESWTDGAGRTIKSRTPMTFNGSGTALSWTGQKIEYDILGQVTQQSVPAEVDATWNLAGDDAVRGIWLWTRQKYDWKGRVTRKINTDGLDSPVENASDILINYEGCGCAGGQQAIIQGELVERDDQPNTFARRTQKIYEDVLGRTRKTQTMKWNGATPYLTTVTEFNGRDQATSVTQTDEYSVSQITSMTYDGFGRLKTEHRPEQTGGMNTTYQYNADDSLQWMMDARGAKTSYGYNTRGLVNSITYTAPTGITLPGAVGFDYDALGNRKYMTDGLGRVDYEYDSLSQMTAEIRQFTDRLPNAPLAGNKFRLEYDYQLSGQVKFYKDPFGQQINYTHDKIGRLGAVTDGATNYASNAQYRAWGALKHLDYGSGTAMNVGGFNDKLQATTFDLKRGATTLMSKQYEFYSDGMVKKETDALNAKFDRLSRYDYLGRLTETRTGAEARGQTDSLLNIPYRNSYQYDAFGNQKQDSFKHYTGTGTINLTYQNNRITFNGGFAPTYDAEGNLMTGDLSVPGKLWDYDASGKLSSTYLYTGDVDEEFFTYDGDGLLVKRKNSHKVGDEQPSFEAVYQIRSSVLKGEVVSERACKVDCVTAFLQIRS